MEKLNLFLNSIPPAIYVLLGVIISSIFNIITSILNNRNSQNIKEIEINNIKNKEIFLTKLKIFTKFLEKRAKLHRMAENIKNNGNYCVDIIDSLYKIQLLIPEKNEEIKEIKKNLVEIANICNKINIYNKTTNKHNQLNTDEEEKFEKLKTNLNNLTDYLPRAILNK